MPLHNHALNMLIRVDESQLREISKHPRCAGKQATEMKMPAGRLVPALDTSNHSTRPKGRERVVVVVVEKIV